MPWTCYLLVETDRASLALRRYATQSCELHGMHDARSLIGTAPVVVDDPTEGDWHVPTVDVPRSDPRWPVACSCGYTFAENDAWQVHASRLYQRQDTGDLLTQRQDTGDLLTQREAGPGAMWHAPWLKDYANRGPDGLSLMVKLPGGGEWMVDAPSRGGPGWTRTGTPPRLTVTPSILVHPSGNIQAYHGFLTDGVLTDDLEGRTYERG